MTKTIQELQQETAEKFDEKFVVHCSDGDILGKSFKNEVPRAKSLLSFSLQSAYDLGCEVTFREERQFILNVLDGIDKADKMGNSYGKTEAIRFALRNRVSPTPESDLSTK